MPAVIPAVYASSYSLYNHSLHPSIVRTYDNDSYIAAHDINCSNHHGNKEQIKISVVPLGNTVPNLDIMGAKNNMQYTCGCLAVKKDMHEETVWEGESFHLIII